MAGYRKLIVVGFAMVSAFILALLQRLTADYATVVSIGVAAFSAGNAVEHLRKKDGGA